MSITPGEYVCGRGDCICTHDVCHLFTTVMFDVQQSALVWRPGRVCGL